jgi:hypothetical protein
VPSRRHRSRRGELGHWLWLGEATRDRSSPLRPHLAELDHRCRPLEAAGGSLGLSVNCQSSSATDWGLSSGLKPRVPSATARGDECRDPWRVPGRARCTRVGSVSRPSMASRVATVMEAAGDEPNGEVEDRSRGPDHVAETRTSEASDGGGGGSRTPCGDSPFWKDVGAAAETVVPRWAPGWRPPTVVDCAERPSLNS